MTLLIDKHSLWLWLWLWLSLYIVEEQTPWLIIYYISQLNNPSKFLFFSWMAGLQYNFFPTDFFFPPPSVNREATGPQVLPTVIKSDETTGDLFKVQSSSPSALAVRREIKKNIILKALPSSSNPLLASPDKKKINQGESTWLWRTIYMYVCIVWHAIVKG